MNHLSLAPRACMPPARFPMRPHAALAARLRRLLTLVLFAAAPALAGGFAGSYSGELNGEPMRASLSAKKNAVTGTLDVGGYVYRIEASRQGNAAEGEMRGEMRDQDGAAVPLRMQLHGDRLALRVYLQGASAAPLEMTLVRGTAQAGGGPVANAGTGERDPALVGRWVRRESYTSGDFSMVDESRVVLYPNGTYQFGPGRVIGGGDAGSFDSGGDGGSGDGGRWRTANRILYTAPAGGGNWEPYARYYVEGNKALLTFGDGSRELWYRE